MLRLKWAIFCVIGLLVAVPAAQADFTLTNPGVSGTGSGESVGTGIISDTGPWVLPEVGGFMDTETVTPSSAAVAFQQSHVEATDGTASVSTSVTHTDTQVIGGDTVTATGSGSTSVTVEKENNPGRPELINEATARLLAAGGSGTVTGNEVFNTTTGFMVADADAFAFSVGNEDPNAADVTDATANAKGAASVNYQICGQTLDRKRFLWQMRTLRPQRTATATRPLRTPTRPNP